MLSSDSGYHVPEDEAQADIALALFGSPLLSNVFVRYAYNTIQGHTYVGAHAPFLRNLIVFRQSGMF